MILHHNKYKYIPIERIEDKCNDLDIIKKLKKQLEEQKNKKKLLLDKISILDIQNYLLKKKVVEYERDIKREDTRQEV